MVDVGQVVEDGEVDDEDAHLGDADRHNGRDPVDGRVGRPAEPEQAHGQQRRLEAGKIQPAFRAGGEFGPAAPGKFRLVD